ncbi:hypothetical protein I2I11_06715 [Pontibacter sp. 172403-2]|uniref:hypothetical protein n=1 Tax=Pontibacter rufus TaxID=2791028 RepID=UPI0018AFC392|nr:hypothetical protein [Pontibacter sp. 172403-2]MBF9252977.1 hypothetical protein [Pontibacter sp. 172403-2]
MKPTRLHYRISDSLGPGPKMVGIVVVLAVAYLFRPHPLLALLLLVIGLLPLLIHKCIEFDLYRGVYRVGVCLAGKTFGREEPYPGVDFLFLKKNRHITETQTRYARFDNVAITFDGFIKFADGTKALLIRVKDKQKAIQFLGRMAKDLEAEVRDFTEGHYY